MKPSITFEGIPLSSIRPDPNWTPDAIEQVQIFEPNKTLQTQRELLYRNTGYIDPLKVKSVGDGTYVLLDAYWSYRLLCKVHSGDPNQNVLALVFSDENEAAIRELSRRLGAFEGHDENHLRRLFYVNLLRTEKWPIHKIRSAFGVDKAKSAAGKKLERDYRIVAHESLCNLVLGTSDGYPNLRSATLSYSLAGSVLAILMDDDSMIDEFVVAYNQYIDSIRNSISTSDEALKPIFKRRSFKADSVKRIAQHIAAKNIEGLDPSLIEEEDEDKDFDFAVRRDIENGLVHVPEIKLRIRSLEDKDIATIVEFLSKINPLVHSLSAHLSRISPVEHGAKVRISDSSKDPSFIVPSNLPKYRDHSYFASIRKSGCLAYCNKRRLYESLDLTPETFGFVGYRSESCSSFAKAHRAFEEWYKSELLPHLSEYYGKQLSGHPTYSIYLEIKRILSDLSEDSRTMTLRAFTNSLFGNVMRFLDERETRATADAQRISILHRDYRSAEWERINHVLGAPPRTPAEIDKATKELFKARKDSSAKIAQIALRRIKKEMES